MVKGVSGGTDDKIQKFNDKLDHLKNVLTDSVGLETSIVTLRVSKQLSEQSKIILVFSSEAIFIDHLRQGT